MTLSRVFWWLTFALVVFGLGAVLWGIWVSRHEEAEDQNTIFDDVSTLDPDTRKRVGERLGKIIKEELDTPEEAEG